MNTAEKKELAVWIDHGKDAFFKTLKRMALRRGWATRETWDAFRAKAEKEMFKGKSSTVAGKLAKLIDQSSTME